MRLPKNQLALAGGPATSERKAMRLPFCFRGYRSGGERAHAASCLGFRAVRRLETERRRAACVTRPYGVVRLVSTRPR